MSLDRLYPQPNFYLDPSGVVLPANPIGLKQGDDILRRTHEVRIPAQVQLRSPHLLAVFSPRNKAYAIAETKALFIWCRENGVDRRYFESPGDGEFSGLRSACIDYLREWLY